MLAYICHGMLPSGIKMRHALRMSKCPLLTMLHNTMESLLAVSHGGIPQSVEGIVHTILEQGNAQHMFRHIHKVRVERPQIEPLFIRVFNVECMSGYSMHHIAPTIMLNRVLSPTTHLNTHLLVGRLRLCKRLWVTHPLKMVCKTAACTRGGTLLANSSNLL